MFTRVLAQPRTWLLRDYHSPNLIALDDRPAPQNVGIIDFQDALVGPAAYDLVSLLQDARVDVAEDLEKALLDHYVSRVMTRDPAFDAQNSASPMQRSEQSATPRFSVFSPASPCATANAAIWRTCHGSGGISNATSSKRGLRSLRAWYDQFLPQSLRAQALKI